MDDELDLAKLRMATGYGPLLSSNDPFPSAPYDQMPSPLRTPYDQQDTPPPPVSVPPPPVNKVAGPPVDPNQPSVDSSPVVGSVPPAKGSPNVLDDMMVTKQDLQDAADKKKQLAMIGGITDALSNQQSFGNFFTGHMNPKHDSSGYFKQLQGMADAPIDQKKVLLAQQLKQPEMELAMRSSDPSSTESQLMGNMMRANIQNNVQMSAEQKAGLLKNIDGKSAAELNKLADSPLFKDMMANDKLFQTLNNKVELANMKAEAYKAAMENKTSKGSQKDQMKTLKETQAAIEQMRGDQSTQQAEKDIYAADKANTLMNLYGDPNKLSKSQVNLVVSEIGKIAQGGAPTMHELEGLNPNTFSGNLSAAWGKLKNDPQPANLAAFVKQYQDYATAVTSDAENHILDRYDRIIGPRRDYLSDHDSKALDEKYTHRFDKARAKRSSAAEAANPKMSDEDAAAFQHIKDQPNDPNAGAIASVLKKKYPNLVK